MRRSLKPRSDLFVAFAGAAILYLLAFGQVAGGPAANGNPQVAVPDSDCPVAFQAPENPAFLSLDGGACKAEAASEMFLAKPPGRPKTCRCSCGAPCQTDADCGGALGSCRVGVTCC